MTHPETSQTNAASPPADFIQSELFASLVVSAIYLAVFLLLFFFFVI
jgi:hypothetical protein